MERTLTYKITNPMPGQKVSGFLKTKGFYTQNLINLKKKSGKRAGKRKVCLPELHSAGWRCAQDHDMRDRGLRADPSGGTAAGYRI